MCLSPLTIQNPSYSKEGKYTYFDTRYRPVSLAYITIPCGKCRECQANKKNAINQRVQIESLFSYVFMLTLTIKPSRLPYVKLPNGELLAVAPWKEFQDMMKRVRKLTDRRIKYYVVSEYGEKRHRPHLHALVFIEKKPTDNQFTNVNLENQFWKLFFDEWRINTARTKSGRVNTRAPHYEKMFDYKKKIVNGKVYSNFDFHLIRPRGNDDGKSSCALYVSKYLQKDNKWVNLQIRKIYAAYGVAPSRPKNVLEIDPDYTDLDFIGDLPSEDLPPTDGSPTLYETLKLFKPTSHCSLNFGCKYSSDSLEHWLKSRANGSTIVKYAPCYEPVHPLYDDTKIKDFRRNSFYDKPLYVKLQYDPIVYNKILSDACRSYDAGYNVPMFYDLVTGKGIMMSRFYRNMLPIELDLKFKLRCYECYDGYAPYDSRSFEKIDQAAYTAELAISRGKKDDCFDIVDF